MNIVLAGIALGLLSLHFWPTLPEYNGFITALMLGGLVCASLGRHLLICISFGVLLANIAATSYLENVQRVSIEPKNITITGQVSSLLNANRTVITFDFVTPNFSPLINVEKERLKFRLHWQQPLHDSTMKHGEKWQLEVKLRPPHGRVNSAGYDAERQFVGKEIHGSGVVLAGKRLSKKGKHSVRQQLFDQTVQATEGLEHQAFLLALGFGFRGELNDQHWMMLRDSGLSHLMAISGLHIGLAVVCGWWVGRIIKSVAHDTPRWQWLPLWIGLLTGVSYAWLAGFSIPTVRALVMSTIVLMLLRFRIQWPVWQTLLFTFTLCLMLKPLASYTAGFWLSFAAVFIISSVAVSGVRTEPLKRDGLTLYMSLWSRVKPLVIMQFALLFLMLPMQWLWFGGFTLLAPVINIIAVPWVSVITVPLVLIAIMMTFWPSASSWVWQAADMSLWPVIYLAEHAKGSWWELSPFTMVMLFGGLFCIALRWFFPFRQFKALYCVLVITLASWFFRENTSRQETSLLSHKWQIHLLDVGHGLALLIEKNGRAVLYDTGNRWQTGSIAASVIAPVLQQKGIHQLDGLILSHADSDHAGGTGYLTKHFAPQWKRSSDVRTGFMPCVRGERWQWQGLEFRAVWPPKRVSRAANPHSCVIEVTELDALYSASLLLTGDIDAISELLLAQKEPTLLPDVLLVPHHGSNSSSTATWLSSMSPRFALVSVAKYSPWKLPSLAVEKRYVDKGTQWLSTAELGQITLDIDRKEISVTRYRHDKKSAWFRTVK
ncbi:DNA internalization-related competence protein ComEC/Rec2 [Photobacterium makurazakiensis]|uniref:DNA internalization-related competence protein ComEC/Rec2 n=1 Tax=Photobacterium makurazakiensis TaxID=2910234 RepID=UPI003D0BA286